MSGFVERQLDVQRRVYGVDPPRLQGHARGEFLWNMVGAAQEELSEIRRCYDARIYVGKPVTGENIKSRDHVLTEIADLLCFVGNIASIEGFTTSDLERAHAAKVEQNTVRHARCHPTEYR